MRSIDVLSPIKKGDTSEPVVIDKIAKELAEEFKKSIKAEMKKVEDTDRVPAGEPEGNPKAEPTEPKPKETEEV